MTIARASEENHYGWGEQCDGWHLVRHGDLSVIQERMPPGTAETRHRHQRSRQFFTVLEGTLAIEVEGRHYQLSAREGLEVPPGAAHQVRNASDAPVDFLVVSAPPSHGDREPA